MQEKRNQDEGVDDYTGVEKSAEEKAREIDRDIEKIMAELSGLGESYPVLSIAECPACRRAEEEGPYTQCDICYHNDQLVRRLKGIIAFLVVERNDEDEGKVRDDDTIYRCKYCGKSLIGTNGTPGNWRVSCNCYSDANIKRGELDRLEAKIKFLETQLAWNKADKEAVDLTTALEGKTNFIKKFKRPNGKDGKVE